MSVSKPVGFSIPLADFQCTAVQSGRASFRPWLAPRAPPRSEGQPLREGFVALVASRFRNVVWISIHTTHHSTPPAAFKRHVGLPRGTSFTLRPLVSGLSSGRGDRGSDDGLSRPRRANGAGGRDHACNRGTARANKFHKPENDDRTGALGHSDQGRFQSFPIHDDEHLLQVCQYVERHARRAGLVDRAED